MQSVPFASIIKEIRSSMMLPASATVPRIARAKAPSLFRFQSCHLLSNQPITGESNIRFHPVLGSGTGGCGAPAST